MITTSYSEWATCSLNLRGSTQAELEPSTQAWTRTKWSSLNSHKDPTCSSRVWTQKLVSWQAQAWAWTREKIERPKLKQPLFTQVRLDYTPNSRLTTHHFFLKKNEKKKERKRKDRKIKEEEETKNSQEDELSPPVQRPISSSVSLKSGVEKNLRGVALWAWWGTRFTRE